MRRCQWYLAIYMIYHGNNDRVGNDCLIGPTLNPAKGVPWSLVQAQTQTTHYGTCVLGLNLGGTPKGTGVAEDCPPGTGGRGALVGR